MSSAKKEWLEGNGEYYLTTPPNHKKLKNQVYTVKQNPNTGQFYLEDVCDTYTFDYKIYGLEAKLIERVLKTYDNTTGNLGMLLNGVKGTGKTVSSKIIANKLNQPTIVITTPYKGVQYFINSIPQDITIFVDEYEKIYGQSNDLLTIMDGAMNSTYRRMFLLTTNKLYIEDNLKERPSRLRYIKRFEDLIPSVVEEIVDDILVHKQFRDECVKFMTTLSLITVDIVKSVINEVNIHEESPFEFGDIFNISKVEGKYKIFELDASGKQGAMLADNVQIYPRPDFDVDNTKGYWFEVNGQTIGKVSEVLASDIITIDVMNPDGNAVIDTVILKAQKSYGTHSNYAWTDEGNVNKVETSDKFNEIISNNEKQKHKKKLRGAGEMVSLKDFEIEPSSAG